MSFSISDTVGPYRIVEELGRGGMGRVFAVEHTLTQRLEAMKVLERGRPDAPEQAERSLREIRVQARLHHPNIAAIHNAFWAGDDLVLVMELIDGCSLRRLLEAGRIPTATAINYTCQALWALSYAHAQGVIHRDISPSNMMIGPDGALKLTDFGLAKGPTDMRVSQSGVPVGSLYYMSPEQVRGTAQADTRSDIYSVGAVLYELVTGKKPFDGDTAFSIMVGHVEKSPTPPLEVEPSIPVPLNSFILRSLEKDPSRRFASAEQFREALINIENSGRVSVSRSLLPFWVIRAATAFAVGILAVASLVLVGSSRGSANPPSSQVVLRPEQPTDAHTLAAAPPTPPAASPLRRSTPRIDRPESSAVEPADVAKLQRSNRIRRALGKLWRLGRHKTSGSESGDTMREPEDQR